MMNQIITKNIKGRFLSSFFQILPTSKSMNLAVRGAVLLPASTYRKMVSWLAAATSRLPVDGQADRAVAAAGRSPSSTISK